MQQALRRHLTVLVKSQLIPVAMFMSQMQATT